MGIYRDEATASAERMTVLRSDNAGLREELVALRAALADRRRAETRGRLRSWGKGALGGMAFLALLAKVMTPTREHSQHQVARSEAMELRRAAENWRATRSDFACPTPERLIRDGTIDAASRLVDPWGSPYRVLCTPDDTFAWSAGPDGQERTADDVRSPP